MIRSPQTLVLAVTSTLSLGLHAQTLEPGYADAVLALPATAQAAYDLPGPGVVYYDTDALVVDDGSGAAPRTLLDFVTMSPATMPPAFASFTVPAGPDAVLFGESSNGEVWFVPLTVGASPRLLATLPGNYDAVLLDTQTALISVNPCSYPAPPCSEVVALDLATGATDRIATLPGFSGPVALDLDGGLLYAGPGANFSTDILKFDAATLRTAFGPSELTELDATIVHAGLPSAGYLAVDADGDIFAADFFGPTLFEVSRDPLAPTQRKALVSYAMGQSFAGKLRVIDAPDSAAFEPWQPSLGKGLSILEQFGSNGSALRTLTPSQPETTVSPSTAGGGGALPPGPVTLTTPTGAATGMTATYAIGTDTLVGLPPISLPGLEQPIFFGVGGVFSLLVASVDGAGDATLTLMNPGFPTPTRFAVQLLLISNAGALPIIGTSVPTTITL